MAPGRGCRAPERSDGGARAKACGARRAACAAARLGSRRRTEPAGLQGAEAEMEAGRGGAGGAGEAGAETGAVSPRAAQASLAPC